MNMHFFLRYFLVLVFAFAQTQALLHEISHTADWLNTSPLATKVVATPSQDSPATHNNICSKCLGYSHLGHATPAAALIALLTQTSAIYSTPTQQLAFSQVSAVYLARAPPATLLFV